ncbi:hypothetical protein ACIQU4_42040 [Streptomyces sp. NPDC090741]
MFRSLHLARLGEERAATDAQDQALTELPASLRASRRTWSSTGG